MSGFHPSHDPDRGTCRRCGLAEGEPGAYQDLPEPCGGAAREKQTTFDWNRPGGEVVERLVRPAASPRVVVALEWDPLPPVYDRDNGSNGTSQAATVVLLGSNETSPGGGVAMTPHVAKGWFCPGCTVTPDFEGDGPGTCHCGMTRIRKGDPPPWVPGTTPPALLPDAVAAGWVPASDSAVRGPGGGPSVLEAHPVPAGEAAGDQVQEAARASGPVLEPVEGGHRGDLPLTLREQAEAVFGKHAADTLAAEKVKKRARAREHLLEASRLLDDCWTISKDDPAVATAFAHVGKALDFLEGSDAT